MGLHGSPTCVIGFENAEGFLLGEVGRGLAQMFVMISQMRLSVGTMGLAISSAAADVAFAYAAERRQGGKPGSPVVINKHPDVRRQLLEMDSRNQLLRSLILTTANMADRAAHESDPDASANIQALVQYLLPIVKTAGADAAFLNASGAIQVLGGAGYTCEWPVEEWLKAREEASSWPIEQGFGAIAINAYTAMTDFLKKLPTEEPQEEVLPAFYALSNPTPEPDPIIPLNAYNLSQPEGRFAFLWALYNDYQEDGLLMAVNHVWDCLDTPRSLRCALMAQKVGKSGTGKQALMRFLKRFLGETLYEFEVPDLPNREAYLHFDEWNDACLEHFDRLNKRMSRIVARYETILDGREPQDDQLVPKHALIKGPWTVAD